MGTASGKKGQRLPSRPWRALQSDRVHVLGWVYVCRCVCVCVCVCKGGEGGEGGDEGRDREARRRRGAEWERDGVGDGVRAWELQVVACASNKQHALVIQIKEFRAGIGRREEGGAEWDRDGVGDGVRAWERQVGKRAAFALPPLACASIKQHALVI